MKQLVLDLGAEPAHSLDTFQVGENAELAHLMHQFAQRASREHFAYLWGDTGAGKTHLLQALAASPASRYIPFDAPEDQFVHSPDVTLYLLDDTDRLSPQRQIDAFDHAAAIWSGDDPDYIAACQRFSERWIRIPVSPSAEQFSRLFFVLIDRLLQNTEMRNGEVDVRLHSIIVHETETGYAQCFREDAYNPRMGLIALDEIEFSEAIQADWQELQLAELIISTLSRAE